MIFFFLHDMQDFKVRKQLVVRSSYEHTGLGDIKCHYQNLTWIKDGPIV